MWPSFFKGRSHSGLRLPRRCFVSHAFADRTAKQALLDTLPPGVEPFIFDEIKVPPTQRVSDDLIRAIRDCHGLIYLQGQLSRQSFWVSFEKDYARRLGMPVYAFDHDERCFSRDRVTASKPNIYCSFALQDAKDIEFVGAWLKKNRQFDVITDKIEAGADFAANAARDIEQVIAAKGGVVLFVSEGALMAHYVQRQIEMAMALNPEQRLVVWLDSPEQIISNVGRHRPVVRSLTTDDMKMVVKSGGQWNWNRIDDLIVRVFHIATSGVRRAAD